MSELWKVYNEHLGKMPPRKLRLQLAKQLNMKENQIYKWFWEINHKQHDGEAQTIS